MKSISLIISDDFISIFFFFKQKTAYEMRISDWSSDVCSSDLVAMKRDTKEGLSTWVCGYSLLAGGQGNEEKVYDYINAFLDDDTAEYPVTEWGYGHANQAAVERIDQETLARMDYANL